MSRILVLSLLSGSAILLSGCVAGMAAGAVGLAVRGARGTPQSNDHLRPAAVAACSERASPHGAVHIIDVERRTTSRMIVWGTVDDGKERRSFQCNYGTKITGFTLRPITPAR